MVVALGLLAAGKSIFEPIYVALGDVIAWLYSVVPSYGWAIVLLTVAVRLVVWPLTIKQVKSQQALQALQPEMKRLQAKYKDDRQKLNEEMMALYREHKVNPFGGCLPLLLQFPLLLVMWRLIYGLVPKSKSGIAGLPKHIPTTSAMYRSLLRGGFQLDPVTHRFVPGMPKGKMISWGMDLAEKAVKVHGFGHALPFYVLIALVVVTSFYQTYQINVRTSQQGQPANQQAQMIGRVMPIVFGVLSLQFPAGVVLYFLVSNVWQIGQQALIFRGQPSAKPAVAGAGAGGGDGSAAGSRPQKPEPSKPELSKPEASRPPALGLGSWFSGRLRAPKPQPQKPPPAADGRQASRQAPRPGQSRSAASSRANRNRGRVTPKTTRPGKGKR